MSLVCLCAKVTVRRVLVLLSCIQVHVGDLSGCDYKLYSLQECDRFGDAQGLVVVRHMSRPASCECHNSSDNMSGPPSCLLGV